jgi:hypothetical protein
MPRHKTLGKTGLRNGRRSSGNIGVKAERERGKYKTTIIMIIIIQIIKIKKYEKTKRD